ncbi:GNAT family N-acetyltransferase, partial [Enterococcus sp.]|uniref:GNAT family N-acetyltransferase n=1 Tax=Enterococcus sp. TaxID=35783 RepID=UPI0025C477FA
MLKICYGQKSDTSFWLELDNHLTKAGLAKKFQDQQALILTDEEEPVGILRYQLFWDTIPFCTMLVIKKSQQRKGRGSHFLSLWEAEMRKQGYGMCMTSIQSDE